MKKQYERNIVVFENHFINFKRKLGKEVLKKIYQVFILIMTVETVPERFLKSISSVKGLYEIRVEESGNIYRIFCCFDNEKIVVLFNAMQKKTMKTPKKEIDKAKKLMNKYFEQKKKSYE